jgi:N-methylhydantoinase A
MRYQGQEHTVNVPLAAPALAEADVAGVLERFGVLHLQHYGHNMEDPVEIVTLRLRAVGVLEQPKIPRIAGGDGDASAARTGRRAVSLGEGLVEYDVYERTKLRATAALAGPAIVEEPSSTTVIHAGDTLRVGELGELIVETGGEAR